MPNFKVRSRDEELLDQPNISQEALFQNLKELDTINRLLGGHQATLVGLKQLITNPDKTYRIVDFACGGGDTLRAVSRWAEKKDLKVELIGFDLLEDAIKYAKKESKGYDIEWMVGDFNTIELPAHDISICSLVCHHFYDEQLTDFLLKMVQSANVAVLVNDLHRNALAYYGINLLTKLFSKSPLVKNDAKLSVLKGFTKKEWEEKMQELSYSNYSIKWIWAFRHLIVFKK
jgi:2-polyprenyl-3-methyl-5-hydroxy-6-metoxy-1,4-benzoquinol methylase